MPDIFLSYSRDDLARARQLAEALAAEGWSVWFDPKIRSGAMFDRAIEHAIAEARCVMVLWSRASVESDWVRAEAGDGLDREILVPVVIEEGVRVPLRYRQMQTVYLSRWDGSRSDREYARLVGDVRHLLLEASVPATPQPVEERPEPSIVVVSEPPEPPRQSWKVEHSPWSIPALRPSAWSERFGSTVITGLMLVMFGMVVVAMWVDSQSTPGIEPVGEELRTAPPPADSGYDWAVVELDDTTLVARARGMIEKKVAYVPGEGGLNPREELGGVSDDLGFLAWAIGIPREFPPGPGSLEYKTFLVGGTGPAIGLFELVSISNARVGDLYISPSYMGIISALNEQGPARVILCTMESYRATGGCVHEAAAFTLKRDSTSFIVRVNYQVAVQALAP